MTEERAEGFHENADVAALERFLTYRTESNFRPLYRRWMPRIQWWVSHVLCSRGYAGRHNILDAVGFVWLCLCEDDYRILRRFDPAARGGHLHGYLKRVVVAKAVDWCRHQKGLRPSTEGVATEGAATNQVEQTILHRDLLGRLTQRFQEKLSPLKYRWFLAFSHGVTTPEWAEQEQVSPNTLNDWRKMFRQEARAIQKQSDVECKPGDQARKGAGNE